MREILFQCEHYKNMEHAPCPNEATRKHDVGAEGMYLCEEHGVLWAIFGHSRSCPITAESKPDTERD